MLSRNVLLVVVLAAVAGLVGLALAQDSQPARPGPGGGMWGPGSQVDPEQIKKMVEQFRVQAEARMKESLGATDDEWKVLGPKIERVTLLSAQASGLAGGRMMAFLRPGDAANTMPEIAEKMDALRKVLENKDAPAAEVTAALKEFRAARAKAKEELDKAQKELKDILTVRQEAVLVTMGLLQ